MRVIVLVIGYLYVRKNSKHFSFEEWFGFSKSLVNFSKNYFQFFFIVLILYLVLVIIGEIKDIAENTDNKKELFEKFITIFS